MKTTHYSQLAMQLPSLHDATIPWYSNMLNILAAMRDNFGFWWIGVYVVQENELVLGPFQGPPACTRIGFGKGVCGKTWEAEQTIIVEDVHAFPGHIACSSASNSEIVVPLIRNGKVVGVLDVDSTKFGAFDQTDKHYLEIIAGELVKLLPDEN